jgi:hypothetical protein
MSVLSLPEELSMLGREPCDKSRRIVLEIDNGANA